MAIETDGVRSVWTQKDQALLVELQERKARIHEENRHRLAAIVEGFFPSWADGGVEETTTALIDNADALRAALTPFCHEGN